MGAPSWLVAAYEELGVHEIAGSVHEERIVAYHAATTLQATADEVPWCSSFVSWCCAEAHVQTTRSARARSWLALEDALDFPELGAIAILSRGGPDTGHVGFWVGFAPPIRANSAARHLILGGNQGDKVSVEAFDHERLLGLRWPRMEG